MEMPVKRTAILLLCWLLPAGTACVPNRMYRSDNIQPETEYTLAYIEFDDQGELWDPSQVSRALDLIDQAGNAESGALVISFVHGWNSNASPDQEVQKGSSLHGFKEFLSGVSASLARANPDSAPPLVGIFLSWRGKSAYQPFEVFSFYSRRRAARRIAGTSATVVLTEIASKVDEYPLTRSVLVGHSFGGLIVERLLQNLIVNRVLRTREGAVAFPIDLVTLINPASPSMQAKLVVDFLARDQVRVMAVHEDGRVVERPLIVSMTSEADSATGKAFPLGASLAGMTGRFRSYGPEHCGGIDSQREFYRRTTGHNTALHSHIMTAEPLETEPDPTSAEADDDPLDAHIDFDRESISFDSSGYRFRIEKLPYAENDTPYWIMRVPKEFIPDHGTIFNDEGQKLLRALLYSAGALEIGATTILERRSGVSPFELIARPGEGIVFLERNRGLYSVRSHSRNPVFLGCLPPGVDFESGIGAFLNEGNLWVVINSQMKDPGSFSTEIVPILPSPAGTDPVTPIRLDDVRRFSSAAFGQEKDILFLATGQEIYSVDLSAEAVRPQLIARIDTAETITAMAVETSSGRLLALDGPNGVLYASGLGLDPIAGMAPIGEVPPGAGGIAVDERLRRVFILNSPENRIWALDCTETACGEPVLFSDHPALEKPHRLAVSDDGDVWVADLEGRGLIQIGPDGDTRRVIRDLD
jgi:pimeloyl-ACP methyl ester carboxylesterase